MLIFLAWGTWAFYYMVKKPLDRISERLNLLAEGKEDKEIDFSQVCLMEYTLRDEIGKIATKLNQILNEYNLLRIFKRVIENDESSELVYERLGSYLKNVLNINYFIIYQVSNSQNIMTPVYVSNPELETTSEIMFDADKCRAKRTGEIVNSMIFPDLCKVFPLKDDYEYCCIPMNYGGKCIGVVAIYIPKEDFIKNSENILENIRKAKLYISEAIPVIEAKRFAEALKEQTFRDALTGLYNRHFLEATLENLVAQILRRESVLGILMCDLDFFKSVNDQYGHDIGDLILKETASILASNVRKSDLVIRFGGEEFLVLLVDIKEGESVKVAEKLRSLIETHEFKIPQGSIRRTISIGVSEFPIDTKAIWEAIKFADVALYKAKELGRNKVVRFKREFWVEESY
ncbi:MAG: GGDEF domain-containing protein, partial [Thermodesulfobacterium sp.]|nr:GGDEF domain-containing protein [Thermodesulfobacterium sp.]